MAQRLIGSLAYRLNDSKVHLLIDIGGELSDNGEKQCENGRMPPNNGGEQFDKQAEWFIEEEMPIAVRKRPKD